MKRTGPAGEESTSQKVEAFIRQAIYEGRLKPRERIIEDDIARYMGCSRGPVREAVLRLERDGMIVITPRRGTFIRDISPDEVNVVFSIRGKLEGLCARYMRESMTGEMEAALLKCLAAMKAAADAADDEAFLQADMRLHRTIWKLSGKRQLYRTLNFTMNPLFFIVARTYSNQLHSVADAYLNHEAYVQTVLQAPVSRVEREVEKYFTNLYKRIHTRILRHSETPFRGSQPEWDLEDDSLEPEAED